MPRYLKKKVAEWAGISASVIAIAGIVVAAMRREPSAVYTLFGVVVIGLTAWLLWGSHFSITARCTIFAAAVIVLATAFFLCWRLFGSHWREPAVNLAHEGTYASSPVLVWTKVLSSGVFLPVTDALPLSASKVICVYNFYNLAHKPQLDYLGVGLAEGVTSRLRKIPKIQVVERSRLHQVMDALKLQEADLQDRENLRQLGNLLGADYSLIGNFECISALTVSAFVVDCATGEVICDVSKTSKNRDYVEAAIAYEVARSLGCYLPQPASTERISAEPATPTLEDKALVLFDAKDYVSAFHAYSRISDRDPNNVSIHRHIEECARLGHLQQRLLERYLRLVQQQPSNAILRNYLGNAYLMLDPQDASGKAQEQYEEALHLDSEFAPPLNNLGIIAFRQGDKRKAESMFKRYLNACQEDATGWVNFGLVYLDTVEKNAKDTEASSFAEEAFRKAIQIQPGLASAYKGLGRLFMMTRRKAEALGAYRCSLMLNYYQPEVRKQVEVLARELDGTQNAGIPTDDFRTRTVLRSKGIAELASRTAEAIARQDFKEAEAFAAELCQILPGNPFAHLLLGRAREGQGRSAGAYTASEEAVQASKKQDE